MMNIMQLILNIENKAQHLVADGDEIKQNFEEELNSEKLRIKAEYDKETEIKIRELRKNISADEKKQIRQIDDMHRKQLQKLAEYFSQNKDEWINEISNSIIR